MNFNIGNYSKAAVAVLSAVVVSLQIYYPGAHWVQVVSAGVGAFLVWLVPNTGVIVNPNVNQETKQ